MDRFQAFPVASLSMLRHASSRLRSLTVKNAYGKPLFQLIARLPNLQRINCIVPPEMCYDSPTTSASYGFNLGDIVPTASLKHIVYSAGSSKLFDGLHWLVSHPAQRLETLEVTSLSYDSTKFEFIMQTVGPSLRSLHLSVPENIATLQPLEHLLVLEQIVLIGYTHPKLFKHLPPSTREITVCGPVYPLDKHMHHLFDGMRDLPALTCVTFVGDDPRELVFRERVNELLHEWVSLAHDRGINLSFSYAPVRASCSFCAYIGPLAHMRTGL